MLGITNPVHRQKLQLKAMDVVLFGYRGRKLKFFHFFAELNSEIFLSAKSSYIKDILLVALLVVAVVAYWFAMYQRKASQKQAQALTTQLGKLKDMEQEFVDLQNKYVYLFTVTYPDGDNGRVFSCLGWKKSDIDRNRARRQSKTRKSGISKN